MKTRTLASNLILVSAILLINIYATTSKRIIRTDDRGSFWTTKALIHKGADVNASNISGKTALHMASIDGSSDIVQLLIDAGVDVNASDNDGGTALKWAVGHLEIEHLLREAGVRE